MQKHRCVKVLPDADEKRKSNQSDQTAIEKSTLTAKLFRELLDDFLEESEEEVDNEETWMNK